MPLVVLPLFAIRRNEQEAVVVVAAVLDDHAAADGRAEVPRFVLHPGPGRALHRLRLRFCVHGEAGGKHLGQDDQVTGTVDPVERLVECPPVRRGVVPGEVSLDQRQGQS